MRKGKDTLVMVGLVIGLLGWCFALAYGVWGEHLRHTKQAALNDDAAATKAGKDVAAMRAARNADTSNFDTVLKF